MYNLLLFWRDSSTVSSEALRGGGGNKMEWWDVSVIFCFVKNTLILSSEV